MGAMVARRWTSVTLGTTILLMPSAALQLQNNSGLLLLIGAAVALWIAARFAADALIGAAAPTAGKMALGHWIPIAAVALGAMLLNRPAVAMGIIFSTAVAALALGSGIVILLSARLGPPSGRNVLTMVLPAALLVFLAGFHGELTIFHAVALALEGIVILLLRAPDQAADPSPLPRFGMLRSVQLILSLMLAFLGAWAAVRGVDHAGDAGPLVTAGLLSATFLSPVLVLPLLIASVDLVKRGQSWTAITSQVGLALLNICALTPLIIAFSYLRGFLADHPWHLPQFLQPFLIAGGPVLLPVAVWRLDIVALIILGLFLVPPALGRWTVARSHGLGLICGYSIYLLLNVLLTQW